MQTLIIISLLILLSRNFFLTIYKIATRGKELSYDALIQQNGLEWWENEVAYMLVQVHLLPSKYIETTEKRLLKHIDLFERGAFTIDGATIISEEKGHFMNLWWFLHDCRYINGYASKAVDDEMIKIMMYTNVDLEIIREAEKQLKYAWIVHHFKRLQTKFANGNWKDREPVDLIR